MYNISDRYKLHISAVLYPESNMYNISLYQNLATNKVTLLHISAVLYPESGKELKAYLPVIILLKLQLNCCQIEDGQCHISFLNITKEDSEHISATTIYVLNFQWLPKNPA
ncbi:hypothetical protein ACJX0J_023606, partial [Zea mays]